MADLGRVAREGLPPATGVTRAWWCSIICARGVLVPDIYDPALNPLYRDVLQHYGAVPLPCRIADPDRKGKVERGVGHAKNTPLKGQRFESLEEAQAYLDHWETRWVGEFVFEPFDLGPERKRAGLQPSRERLVELVVDVAVLAVDRHERHDVRAPGGGYCCCCLH